MEKSIAGAIKRGDLTHMPSNMRYINGNIAIGIGIKPIGLNKSKYSLPLVKYKIQQV
ncbi:hypothetical protein [Anaerocolumna xylanovorans]|uniref:hypothetical protein n=1 Tax=Anaerocolumna xylanovorans TaxID=100134 RepID=UPI00158818A0|nr:hypothetical protein [Anaerocolumna xylanovorans]